ncbi:MAG: DUF4160 domain-containing protein [Rhodobiaceae bacterium]|nr:DUF4160 domain-containing protein [Rhodobiaceae bacterium]
MPVVHRLGQCVIRIYADDHDPPHFHVIGPDWSYVVDIRTLRVVRGKRPANGDRQVFGWARENRDRLMREWEKWNERD